MLQDFSTDLISHLFPPLLFRAMSPSHQCCYGEATPQPRRAPASPKQVPVPFRIQLLGKKPVVWGPGSRCLQPRPWEGARGLLCGVFMRAGHLPQGLGEQPSSSA